MLPPHTAVVIVTLLIKQSTVYSLVTGLTQIRILPTTFTIFSRE